MAVLLVAMLGGANVHAIAATANPTYQVTTAVAMDGITAAGFATAGLDFASAIRAC